MPTVAPFGTWKSPIDIAMLTAGRVRLAEPRLEGQACYWLEGRATEAGRVVLVRRSADGTTRDLTPPGFNTRTRVHEYGGGAWAVDGGDVVISNFADNLLYRLNEDGSPVAITADSGHRYADIQVDRRRNRLIAVREDHTAPGEAVTTIVGVSLPEDASGGTVLVSGSDFYSNPRLSPDGNHLAWLSWNHPNMPWDGCTLWEAEILPNGWLGKPESVAGGAGESIFQPTYSPDGDLWFVSDRTGWWNLYRRRNGAIEAIAPSEQEFGEPAWVFGMTTYAFVDADTVLAGHTTEDGWALTRIDTRTLGRTQVPIPYSGGDGIDAHDGRVIMLGTSATKPGEIALIDPASGAATTLRVASAVTLDPAWISIAETFAFPTEGGLTAYAYLYMPKNPEFSAPEGERPPLLVQSHGGPTAGTSTSFDPTILYWTSRGFCVLDVDYGGSTGYGRAYRERLNGQWGIVDVDDCVNGARRLIAMGVVDPDRVAVRGWSASGYLTLAALAFRDVFTAGVSHFGISDLETMAADTHKFESRYLDGLIGPYPAAKQTYVERSPIHYVEQLTVPLALFQGGEDKIVPPDQAELMYEAVKARGIPTALVIFPEEGHGFRAAENIRVATEGELYFYGQVFGFTPHGEIATIEIANL